jgi:hypothetical protein
VSSAANPCRSRSYGNEMISPCRRSRPFRSRCVRPKPLGGPGHTPISSLRTCGLRPPRFVCSRAAVAGWRRGPEDGRRDRSCRPVRGRPPLRLSSGASGSAATGDKRIAIPCPMCDASGLTLTTLGGGFSDFAHLSINKLPQTIRAPPPVFPCGVTFPTFSLDNALTVKHDGDESREPALALKKRAPVPVQPNERISRRLSPAHRLPCRDRVCCGCHEGSQHLWVETASVPEADLRRPA